jgi:hypothetical protein
MFPPIFATVAANATVQALLGVPVRFFPFGEADPQPKLPYAVWQTAYGSPLNSISDIPDTDSIGTQIDVYADEATKARDAAKAIRDAIEPAAHVTAINGEFRDPVTRNYRYSFTADWFVTR